jgi:hypothetical protein
MAHTSVVHGWIYFDHCCVYPVPPPDNYNVRGNKTNLNGLSGGQTAVRIDAASVWWEQPRCLDAINAIGSDANDGQLDAPAPADA